MRSYGEAIEVRTLDPGARPGQFLWRGRLYVVLAVLAHWVELGTWWTGSPRRPVSAPAPAPAPASTPAPEPEPVRRRSVAVDVGAVEREVWRVEARAGRGSAVGVYDLVRDVPAAAARVDEPAVHPPAPVRWRLARALD